MDEQQQHTAHTPTAMLPHSTLERADSGGSASSSSSDTTSVSACSSLFSKGDEGDAAERRGSFASSVFEEDDENHDDKQSPSSQAIEVTSSSESTPSPGLHHHHHHQPLPARIDYSRSPPSSDGSSTHSHDSYISTTNMQTPTAELYALSLHPLSPASQATPDSASGDPSRSAQHATAATTTPNAITPESSSKPSSSHANNRSPAHSNSKLPPATSSEMLRFAQRVASRGVSFTYKTALPAINNRKGPNGNKTSTSNRPSTANGRIMSAEGFPWTARPSSYTPGSSAGGRSAGYRPSSSSSSASTSNSSQAERYGRSSSFIASPSAIFSALDDSDIEEDEESEALSSLFPSTYSTSATSSSSSLSSSRPTTRDSSSAKLNTNSTALHHHQLQQQQGDQYHAARNSKSGADLSNMLRQNGEDGHTTTSRVKNDKDGLNAGAIPMYPAGQYQDQHRNGVVHESSRQLSSNILPPKNNDQDYHQSSIVTVSDQHFRTPLGRFHSGVQESRAHIGASSRDELRLKEAQRVPASSSSSSSSFSSYSETNKPLSSHSSTRDRDSTSRSVPVNSTPPLPPPPQSPSSLFRYEAPMAAAVALPLQLQPEPPHHQVSHQTGSLNTKDISSSSFSASSRTATQQIASTDPSQSGTGLKLGRLDSSFAPLNPILEDAMNHQDASHLTSRNDDQKKGASTSISASATATGTIGMKDASVLKTTSPSTGHSTIPFSTAAMMGVATTALPDTKSNLKSASSFDHGDSTRGISHLNSLNYHAGKGDNTYSTLSSSPATAATAAAAAVTSGYAASILSRPNTAASTRPWVKDSDASSIRSSSGASEGGSSSFDGGSANEHQLATEASVMSPAAPPPVPFLSTAPAPPGCKIQVEALQPDGFDVYVTLPGFTYENITLALKRNGALHILADKYDDGSAGHFERMVELGEAAMNCKVTAEFNGQRLKVLMRKKAGYSSRSSISSAASSASSHTTISSNGSSSSAAFNHISNPQHRNSDQLNCDPAFGGITATSSSSRDSSFSNSSLVVSSGSYSPHLYFGGTDPATFYSSSPTMFGDTMHSKGLN